MLCERSRSTRTSRPFAIVRLTRLDGDLTRQDFLQLERVLRKRLREYDSAGLLEPGMFVILLPETDREGGLKVADDIQKQMGNSAELYQWQVAQYPAGDGWRGPDDDVDPDERDKSLDGADKPAASPAPRPPHPVEVMLSRSLPAWKRGIDIALSSIGLAIAAPILGVAALAIKLTSRGPVFFQQRRAGAGGQPFTMYKLRTMSVDAEKQQKALAALNEQDGPAFKIEHDPRITPVGYVLRTTCIDELPQLWNVLRGEMSIVGPRPLPCHESDACLGWRRARLDLTPGLTCIWQVKGRSKVSFDEWMRMDLEYARRQSLLFDLRLILGTIGLVLKSVTKLLPGPSAIAASPAA